MLLIAVVAGVMAMILAFTYISSATSSLEQQQAEPTESVLFVTSDLPANHVLDPDVDLRTDRVGVRTSPGLARSAVKADEFEAVRGQRITSPIPAGMPLLYSHLATIQDLELTPGMRALSIDVDDTGLLGGILVPGDHVDILVSYPVAEESGQAPMPMDTSDPQAALGAVFAQVMSQSANPAEWQADMVLSDVRVLAIGAQLGLSRQQQMFGPETGLGGFADSNIVTLEVTIQQALDLVKASAGGANRISILLRPPVQEGPTIGGEGSLLEGGG